MSWKGKGIGGRREKEKRREAGEGSEGSEGSEGTEEGAGGKVKRPKVEGAIHWDPYKQRIP
jgi:hypothetical protein